MIDIRDGVQVEQMDALDNTTQCDKILCYMLRGFAITPLEALRMFGCFRLAARIFDLKDRGHVIHCRTLRIPGGKKVSAYFITHLAK